MSPCWRRAGARLLRSEREAYLNRFAGGITSMLRRRHLFRNAARKFEPLGRFNVNRALVRNDVAETFIDIIGPPRVPNAS